MNDFVNDECACAVLNVLSKARSSLYNSSKGKIHFLLFSCKFSFSLVENAFQY
jgi:hypothetical protein